MLWGCFDTSPEPYVARVSACVVVRSNTLFPDLFRDTGQLRENVRKLLSQC
jgi:hypothetical protein